jgi:D-tyrosyl-tRNA(Tyr) deacylase
MRAVVQRVTAARVTVGGEAIGVIGPGVVVLVGVSHRDGLEQARWLADKVANLRIFADAEGKMNVSLLESGGEAMVVSQFTLYGDARKGRRPSFIHAAQGPEAEAVYGETIEALASLGVRCARGRFGAMIQVELTNEWYTKPISSSQGEETESGLSVARFEFVNDGPVTILLDSDKQF